MGTIKLTAKEIDAVRCMLRYWYEAGNTFLTRKHGKFSMDDMEQLRDKLIHTALRDQRAIGRGK